MKTTKVYIPIDEKNGNVDNKRDRMTDAQPREEYEQLTFDFGDEV
jgi:hypothetical protein